MFVDVGLPAARLPWIFDALFEAAGLVLLLLIELQPV
jgi:hypothetical protein